MAAWVCTCAQGHHAGPFQNVCASRHVLHPSTVCEDDNKALSVSPGKEIQGRLLSGGEKPGTEHTGFYQLQEKGEKKHVDLCVRKEILEGERRNPGNTGNSRDYPQGTGVSKEKFQVGGGNTFTLTFWTGEYSFYSKNKL